MSAERKPLPRIAAIVQARMGSTRLPGKVLKPIAGKPLLWHVAHRLQGSKFIQQIAIATTTDPRDEPIVDFAHRNGLPVVRGPEENVLDRFALAADELQPDIIVRVSSDAPFIDAGFVDHLLAAMIEQDGDYVLIEDGLPVAHDGVDPFTRRALNKLMHEADGDPVAREHVTGYFKIHPDFVKIARAPVYAPLAREGARLSIDTPDDLAFAEAVYRRLNAPPGEAALTAVLDLLQREPALRTINAHVRQKAIGTRGALALIRCDGGGRFGYGHVKRTVTLARALRDEQGIGSVFAVNGTPDALEPIARAGFEGVRVEPARDKEQLSALLRRHSPEILVCDLREGLMERDLRSIGRSLHVAAIDDASGRRLAADTAYYPPVPQAFALDWTGSACQPRIGWQWMLLGSRSVCGLHHDSSASAAVLVTMGGTDPSGLTERVARALAMHAPAMHVRFVIGQGMADRQQVAQCIRTLAKAFEVVDGPEDLSREFANCEIALCAFGVTAYELAASGVPALYLSLTDDHARSASAFEKAGLGLSLGVHDRLADEDIVQAVTALFSNHELKQRMRAAGPATIDGNGASRIAADIRARLDTYPRAAMSVAV